MMLYSKQGDKYILEQPISYYSKRYGKSVSLEPGYISDGATGAIDIYSTGWWIHDKLCDTGKWDDGTPVTNWQASRVLADILWREKRFIRSYTWLIATFIGGGGEARKNGMFKLKKNQAPVKQG